VNPDLTQGFKTTTVAREEAHFVGDDAVAQIYSQGLQLGVELAEPELLSHDPAGKATPPAGSGAACTDTGPVSTVCAPPSALAPRSC